MIHGSVQIRFSADGKLDDADRYCWGTKSGYQNAYINVDMHWRESIADFAIWALRKYPDAIYIDVTEWCATDFNNRDPIEDEFDKRPYCKEIDGEGWCIQDQPEYRYKLMSDGLWYSLANRDCLDWEELYPEAEFPREEHRWLYDWPADFLNNLKPIVPVEQKIVLL